MVAVLIVDKNGVITETNLKAFSLEEICKKAKIKTVEDYTRKQVWTVRLPKESESMHIALYARTKGRAGQENKYEFPPPIDHELFFGKCMLVRQTDVQDANDAIDLTKSLWKRIYDKLFGGFDDCMDSEEESDDDMEGMTLSKAGYALDDGFVVEDEDEDEDEEQLHFDDEEEYNTEDEKPKTKKKGPKGLKGSKDSKSSTKDSKSATKTKKETQKEPKKEQIEVVSYEDCDSELEEEDYFEN
tara:strand:- start:166 stop:894 length:729 start_codon:yes stop_codon:yes gene_type:complete